MIPEDFSQSRILIVDDNELNVEQLEFLLDEHGYRNLRSLTDPRLVQDFVAEFQPDIILLDLHMPHINGIQLIEILRTEQAPDDFLPILVLTADVGREAREHALATGAQDFLTKPFEHAEVLLRMRNLLRTRHLHLQLREQNDFLGDRVRERTEQLSETTTELRHTQDRLLAQERLRAMGEMASGIAHDFNNAVSIILGHTEIFRCFPDLIEDRSEILTSLNEIGTAATDAASIVTRMREFYQPDAENETEDLRTAVAEVVRTAVSLTRPRWKNQAQSEGRTISITTDLKDVIVSISASHLREILTNLIFNAVDAMPDGGKIHITSRQHDHFGEIEVRDTGSGMDEETSRRCLEPFYTTKGSAGTGLGLGMVNGIIRRHHGQLEIDTAPGKGTTIRIQLPLNTRAFEDDTPQDDRLDRSLNVLVVDDDDEIREMLGRFLVHDGHTCTTAANGREALSHFFAEAFDLVITDRAMPSLNGDQLVRIISQRSPKQPIIMFTGFGEIMKAKNDCPPGVSILLSKPLRIPELRLALLELFAPPKALPSSVAA